MAFDYTNYYRLDYIQASGTQYINTELTATSGMSFKTNCMFLASSGASTILAQSTSSNYAPWISQHRLRPCVANTNATVNLTLNEWHEIEVNSTNAIVDGTTITYGTQSDVSVGGYIWLFRRADGSYYGKGRIKDLQIYSNNTLVRSFIPAMRKSDSVVGMYDEVNDVFYTNSGTGTFTYGSILYPINITKEGNGSVGIGSTAQAVDYKYYPEGSDITLTAYPDSGNEFIEWELTDYIRLKAISSTTYNNYIDTGLNIPLANLEIELDLSVERSSGSHCIFGTGYAQTIGYMINYLDTSTSVHYYLNGETGTQYNKLISNTASNTRHIAKLNSTGFYVDDVLEITRNTTAQTSNTTSNLLLFCSRAQNSSTPSFYSEMTLYGAKIKNNGILVRNYIPVMLSTDESGLLDLCEMKFYPSNGTGSFTGILDDSDPYGKVKITDNPISFTLRNEVNITAHFISTSNIHLKTSSGWVSGTTFIKINDTWKEGTPYIKINGEWKEGG